MAMAPKRPIGEVPLLEYERKVRDQLETGGLWACDTRGPDRKRLRPFGPRDTPGFPVYPDLESRLLKTAEHPDSTVAHVLATCAAYAYSDAATLSTIMARMGLMENHCRMVTSSIDGMFIRSTAFLIQSNSGRVAILCYRGTEPASFINWLTDADVEPEKMGYHFGDPCATVHAGFYRNVRITRHEVMWALKRACNGESVRRPLPEESDGAGPPKLESKLEALYVTGHSLGGAMAAMMGVMLRHERKYSRPDDDITGLLRAVYTFGQPMIGDPSFAKACQKDSFLHDKMIRYVYDSDVVPHLPPSTSGPFRHFGREWVYRVPHLRHSVLGLTRYLGSAYNIRDGHWEERKTPSGQVLSALGGIGLSVLAFVANKIQPLRCLPMLYSFEDHRPHHYITALTPYGVSNEFGD
jgi:Lipase (class 3)